jgi:hypothetical protein
MIFPSTSSNCREREFFLTFVTITVISGAFGRIPLISRSKKGTRT